VQLDMRRLRRLNDLTDAPVVAIRIQPNCIYMFRRLR